MSFCFKDLTEITRSYMSKEFIHDIDTKTLYYSERLTEEGKRLYPELLREAINNGNETTLADKLDKPGILETSEISHRNNKKYEKSVPKNAHKTLAEGEFNRFYIRGLCQRAIANNSNSLTVYRAKQVTDPRPESELAIDKLVNPLDLLNDLRDNKGIDTILNLPPGPNSGLSVCLQSDQA